MPDRSILIIGAGLAGIATGSYGQMNGYDTHLVEHHTDPGGVATAWTNQGYLMDGGIHYLMGHRPGQANYALYDELGIFEGRTYPDLDVFVHFTDETTGHAVSFGQDLDRLAADLKRIAPDDARIVDELIAGARAMQRSDIFGAMALSSEVYGWRGVVKQAWAFRRVFRYFSPRFNQPMQEYTRAVKDDGLRRMLENFFLPHVPVWFVLLLLGLLANRQLGLLPKGCPDFVASMTERYRALGGRMTFNATVTEILVERDRAVGVRLADGRELRADVVVSTGDGHRTIFELLHGRYVGPEIAERYRTWPLLPPVITISYGVRREYPAEPALNFVFLKEPLRIGDVVLTGFPLRIFNYGSGFAPPGCTVVQPLLHTEWAYWNDLQRDRPRYEAAKRALATEVLGRLESRLPGIASQVEVTDVATPYTTWRYTLNREGAFMGWLPTPKGLRSWMPKTLPGLENFYMAGQWIAPGGGVPPVLLSAKQVVQLICRNDRRPFVTNVPASRAA